MAKLSTKARKALPASAFAGPGRSYPVNNKAHAANAKARVANKSPALKARVDAKANKVLHARKGMSKVPKGPIAQDKLSSMVKSLRTP